MLEISKVPVGLTTRYRYHGRITLQSGLHKASKAQRLFSNTFYEQRERSRAIRDLSQYDYGRNHISISPYRVKTIERIEG